MIDHGIGTKEQIARILAAFRPGEMVTASVIAKRCGITVAKAARTLALIRDTGNLAYRLDPKNRQRWVYGLKAERDGVAEVAAKLDLLLEKIFAVNIVISEAVRFAERHGKRFELPVLDEDIRAAKEAIRGLRERA